ncbi:MAG: hypothetical protein LKH58_04635, partial [Lactobacillus amylovorus]|nr:hypothetical protein [Lactobacillus amylovorus]
MNLKKYGAKKKVKPSNFHFKNKKHRNSLKIMNFCVFISGLKIKFLPRHFALSIISFHHPKFCCASWQRRPEARH